MSPHPDASTATAAGARSALLTAMLATTAAALPVFLLGALSVLVRADLGFSEVELGWAVSSYFIAAAIASIPGGRMGERFGARVVMTVSAAATALSLISIGLFVHGMAALVASLALAGVASSWVEPSANLALATSVPRERQGLFFGWKQATVPLAGFLSGWSVPLIGTTLGWRWAFLGGAVIALSAVFFLAQQRSTSRHRPTSNRVRIVDRSLVFMAIAGGMGMAAVISIQTFFVEAMVASGMTPARAGGLLALGGILGIVARVFWGWRADRVTAHSARMVAILLSLGAVGCMALAAGGDGLLRWIGPVLAFGAGWGWTGLFHLAVVRAHPAAPSAASGIASFGGRIGGIVGPLAFGLIVTRAGFGPAWTATATALGLGAVAAWVASSIGGPSAVAQARAGFEP